VVFFYNYGLLTVSPSNNQVDNRDMSIAVLRTFISKRKHEHEALLLKRTKGAQKAPEKDSSEPDGEEAAEESVKNDENTNGECEVPEEVSQDEPCSISKELVKAPEGKGRGEMRPPRVLEVFLCSDVILVYLYNKDVFVPVLRVY
jgi:tRNA (guanine26-N2/guanine27-N2)-dimethyltransferase